MSDAIADPHRKYASTKREFEILCEFASRLSQATSGRQVTAWEVGVASDLFSKICCHAITVQRLAPTGLTPVLPGASELWDLSSICAIVRCLSDSYYKLYYLAVDRVPAAERDFRQAVWELHGEQTRLRLLQFNGNSPDRLQHIRTDVDGLMRRVQAHQCYSRINEGQKNKIADGRLCQLMNNSDLSDRAGISKQYYKMVFDYLSSHVHAFGLAGTQLAAFRAGSIESLGLIGTTLEMGTAFLAVAIRDYWGLWPSVEVEGDEGLEAVLTRISHKTP